MMKTKVWILALVVFLGASVFLAAAASGGPPKGVSVKKTDKPQMTRSRSATTRISTTKKSQKPNARRQNSISAYINQRNNPATSVTTLGTRKNAPSQATRQGRSRNLPKVDHGPETRFVESLLKGESHQKGLPTTPTRLNDRRISYADSNRQTDSQKIISRALAPAKPLPREGTQERKEAIQKLALSHVSSSGISVIGSNPQYRKDGIDMGSSFFHIDARYKISTKELNDANMHFIDSRAKKRDTFQITKRKDEIKQGSQLSIEVNRLIHEHHYFWSANGYQLKPPKGNPH